MTTDARAGSYNYFHVAGGHAPLQFDEQCNYIGTQEISYANERRQVSCTLRQIERLAEALKRLGIYDQTMIVVNGDHGTPGLPSSTASETERTIWLHLVGKASALVLIKPIGARVAFEGSYCSRCHGRHPGDDHSLVGSEWKLSRRIAARDGGIGSRTTVLLVR
jgi:hypothetical protein